MKYWNKLSGRGQISSLNEYEKTILHFSVVSFFLDADRMFGRRRREAGRWADRGIRTEL